jgi:hypothetical protein
VKGWIISHCTIHLIVFSPAPLHQPPCPDIRGAFLSSIATRPALPSSVPAGEPRSVPVPFPHFRVLFRKKAGRGGKVVQPSPIRTLLHHFSMSSTRHGSSLSGRHPLQKISAGGRLKIFHNRWGVGSFRKKVRRGSPANSPSCHSPREDPAPNKNALI